MADPPVDEGDGAVGPRPDGAVVADDDHRHAEVVAQAEEQVEHALGGGRVERSGGLVGEQQAWLVGERARHGDALALAARQLGGTVLGAVGEPHFLQQRERATASLGMVDAGSDQRDFDVRPRRERPQQQVALEDEADDLAAGAGGTWLLPDRAAVDEHAAVVGLLEAADQARSVLLPEPGAAGDRDRLAGVDLSETSRSALTRPKLLLAPSTITAAPAGRLMQ